MNWWKKTRRKLARFAGLSWRERGLFLAAGGWLLVVDLSLRTLGYARTARLLEHRGPGRRPPADDALIATCDWLVRSAAAHHLYPMRCLPRSLALRQLLRRRGIETEFRIGVHREDGRLVAHAWLEWAGKPIGEPEEIEERFAVLVGERSGEE